VTKQGARLTESTHRAKYPNEFVRWIEQERVDAATASESAAWSSMPGALFALIVRLLNPTTSEDKTIGLFRDDLRQQH
jgi:hypothetical protein